MLACVFILCTCFVTYIYRLDWEKAAKEVTQALGRTSVPCWDGTGSISCPVLTFSALEQNAALYGLQPSHDIPVLIFLLHKHSVASRFPPAPCLGTQSSEQMG